jgi:hypothetical protein
MMLGDQQESIDATMEVQDSVQDTVADESCKDIQEHVHEERFDCRWEACDQTFQNLRDLALHVNNSHIAALPWNTRY